MDFSKLLSGAGDLLATAAPTLATAVLGPFGGMAVQGIEELLGVDPGSKKPAELGSLLQTFAQTPDNLLKLKELDVKLATYFADNDLQFAKVAAEDRDSARRREVEAHDGTPRMLAIFVTLGFFGMLAAMLHWDVPPQNKDMVNIMLGSLGAAWVAVVSYYFGSTASGRSKDATIANLSK